MGYQPLTFHEAILNNIRQESIKCYVTNMYILYLYMDFCRVFTYIHSLLIEKDGRVRRNILLEFPCVFVCLSYSDLFNFW